jgi:hypothetical protein
MYNVYFMMIFCASSIRSHMNHTPVHFWPEQKPNDKAEWYSIKHTKGWVLVAHASNLSYSRGRGQENQGSRVTLGKKWDPVSKIHNTKKGWYGDVDQQ